MKALTYSKGPLEGDVIPLHALNGFIGDSGLSILQDRSNINWLPLDGGLQVKLATRLQSYKRPGGKKYYVCGSEDILDGLRDLRTNAITLNQSDCVLSLYR